MTRVLSPGGGSSDSISINPQDVGDVAPLFTNASHLTFEQDLAIDTAIEGAIGEMKLLHSLADFAEALQKFKERMSEIMHCIGNEETMVGEALVGTALAFGANESIVGNMFKQLNPQYGTKIPFIPPSDILPLDTSPTPSTSGDSPTPSSIPGLSGIRSLLGRLGGGLVEEGGL